MPGRRLQRRAGPGHRPHSDAGPRVGTGPPAALVSAALQPPRFPASPATDAAASPAVRTREIDVDQAGQCRPVYQLRTTERVDDLRDRLPGRRMPLVVRQLQVAHHRAISVGPPRLPASTREHHHTLAPPVRRHAHSRVPTGTRAKDLPTTLSPAKQSPGAADVPTSCGSPASGTGSSCPPRPRPGDGAARRTCWSVPCRTPLSAGFHASDRDVRFERPGPGRAPTDRATDRTLRLSSRSRLPALARPRRPRTPPVREGRRDHGEPPFAS